MTLPLSDPLTPEEFDELDAFLLSEGTPDECMDISMLDGFLAALAIRPDLVAPSMWLPEVWGSKDGPGFRDQEQAEHVLSLILRYYNDAVWYLREAADEYEPVFYTRQVDEKSYQIVDEWCEGFVRGLKLQNPAWGHWQRDPELKEFLGPFLLFGTPEGWKEMEKAGGETARQEERVAKLLPALRALRHKWSSEARPAATPPSTHKVGRNDACPCGSGRKHKHCCGLHL